MKNNRNTVRTMDNARLRFYAISILKTRKNIFNMACIYIMEGKNVVDKKRRNKKPSTVAAPQSKIVKCSNSIFCFGCVLKLKAVAKKKNGEAGCRCGSQGTEATA